MSNNAQTLDLAQRVAEALSRTDEPRQPMDTMIFPEDVIILGVVPKHLRHLAILAEDLLSEDSDAGLEVQAIKRTLIKADATPDFQATMEKLDLAEIKVEQTENFSSVVLNLLFLSLDMHITPDAECVGATIRSDWSVIGLKATDEVSVGMTR